MEDSVGGVNVDIQAAVNKAKKIADEVVAPAAAENDRNAQFNHKAIDQLGQAGLLGVIIPEELGGAGLGVRAFSAVATELARVDPSVAMVFVMHNISVTYILNARETAPAVVPILRDIAAGKHLTTLAFSERGSRSHFWAPVSRAEKLQNGRVRINAQKSFVTSAGEADSYCVVALREEATGPTDATFYLIDGKNPGVKPGPAWDGMGLRANSSGPMTLESCEVGDDMRLSEEGKGFDHLLSGMPIFNLGATSVCHGICQAVVEISANHLKRSTFQHLENTPVGAALPTIRQELAEMQIQTSGLGARLEAFIASLESPDDTTQLKMLESKAAAGSVVLDVTRSAMHICGGVAYSRVTPLERLFRDAHGIVQISPTGDVLREFVGKALLGLPLFE